MPPGFVVTTAAFDRFIADIDPEGSIRRAIEGLATDDLLMISRVAEAVRERIVSASVPDDLARGDS